MTVITDNGFARISKETILRDPTNSRALTGEDIAYDTTTTINEAVDNVDYKADTKANLAGGNSFSDNQTFDTSTLVVDSVNNRVGIGTATPSDTFDLKGTERITNPTGSGYSKIQSTDNGISGTLLYLDPIPEVSGQAATIRLFRETNTSGATGLQIFRGNGTASTNTLFQGNGDSYLNATLGNVGIGEASPTRKLHVTGTSVIGLFEDKATTSSYVDIKSTSGQLRMGMFGGVAGIAAGTGVVPQISLVGGAIGLGTTTPGANITVASNAAEFQGRLVSTAAGGYVQLGLRSTTTDGGSGTFLKLSRTNLPSSGDTKAEVTTINGGISTTALTLGDNGKHYFQGGNVGIGTASPTSVLHTQTIDSINRATVESSSAGANLSTLILEADGPNNLSKVISQKGAGDITARNLGFYTGTSERMRVATSGNVGIGETAPDYKLDVNGSLGITPGIGTTVTPVDNGDLTISTASNTSVVIRLKGSDGVVRSVTLTLA